MKQKLWQILKTNDRTLYKWQNKTTIVGNLGSSIIQHNALQRGDVNMSAVRYTGTELTSVLDAPPTKDTKSNVRVTKII